MGYEVAASADDQYGTALTVLAGSGNGYGTPQDRVATYDVGAAQGGQNEANYDIAATEPQYGSAQQVTVGGYTTAANYDIAANQQNGSVRKDSRDGMGRRSSIASIQSRGSVGSIGSPLGSFAETDYALAGVLRPSQLIPRPISESGRSSSYGAALNEVGASGHDNLLSARAQLLAMDDVADSDASAAFPFANTGYIATGPGYDSNSMAGALFNSREFRAGDGLKFVSVKRNNPTFVDIGRANDDDGDDADTDGIDLRSTALGERQVSEEARL